MAGKRMMAARHQWITSCGYYTGITGFEAKSGWFCFRFWIAKSGWYPVGTLCVAADGAEITPVGRIFDPLVAPPVGHKVHAGKMAAPRVAIHRLRLGSRPMGKAGWRKSVALHDSWATAAERKRETSGVGRGAPSARFARRGVARRVPVRRPPSRPAHAPALHPKSPVICLQQTISFFKLYYVSSKFCVQ